MSNQEKCCDVCAYPFGLKTSWCPSHPQTSQAEYQRLLIERSKEVGLNPFVVNWIRCNYWLDQKKLSPGELIVILEHKIARDSKKQNKSHETWVKALEVLKKITFPNFLEIVKPYEN